MIWSVILFPLNKVTELVWWHYQEPSIACINCMVSIVCVRAMLLFCWTFLSCQSGMWVKTVFKLALCLTPAPCLPLPALVYHWIKGNVSSCLSDSDDVLFYLAFLRQRLSQVCFKLFFFSFFWRQSLTLLAPAGLELADILLQPPECWDLRVSATLN